MSHPARGAWIETSGVGLIAWVISRRTPRGVRGLKHLNIEHAQKRMKSHPARGAWIETIRRIGHPSLRSRRTPRGVRGLKPDRIGSSFGKFAVAPRAGCVD